MNKSMNFFVQVFLLFAVSFLSASSGALTTSADRSNHGSMIAAGESVFCSIHNGGEVVCWGNHQNTKYPEKPYERGVSNAKQLSVGRYTGCAVNGDGDVYCWSLLDNQPAAKQLFSGHAVSVLVEEQSGCVTSFEHLNCADEKKICAITNMGDVECALNDGGAKKVSDVESIVALTAIDSAATIRPPTVSNFWNGDLLFCGVQLDGGVVCWGYFLSKPTKIRNATSVRQIAMVDNGICLLRSNHHVYCAKGLENLVDFKNFKLIENTNDIRAISGGSDNRICTISGEGEGYLNSKCFSMFDEAEEQAMPGYLTTLGSDLVNTYLKQISMADKYVCAANPDNTVSCMDHGRPNPLFNCDIAVNGWDCFFYDPSPNPHGVLGVPIDEDVKPGKWYTHDNYHVEDFGRPIMFLAPYSFKVNKIQSTSIAIEFNRGSTSSDADVYYRKVGSSAWTKEDSDHTYTNDIAVVTISGLKAKTQYEFRVRGKNWASYTNYTPTIKATTKD